MPLPPPYPISKTLRGLNNGGIRACRETLQLVQTWEGSAAKLQSFEDPANNKRSAAIWQGGAIVRAHSCPPRHTSKTLFKVK